MTVLYANSFTGADGSAPADLVLSEAGGTGGTRDVQSNTFRMLTTAATFNNQRAIVPSAKWNQVDGEQLIDFTIPVGQGQAFLTLRGSGVWHGTDDTAATLGYRILINMAGDEVYFFKDNAGIYTQLGATVTGVTFLDSTTYRCRYRVVGTASTVLSFQAWPTSGSDPGGWLAQRTDSSSPITSAGQAMFCFRTVAAAARQLNWDNLSLDDLVVTATSGPRPRLMRV